MYLYKKKKKAKTLKVNAWHTNTHTENVLKGEAYYSKNKNSVFIPNLEGLYPNEDQQFSMLQEWKDSISPFNSICIHSAEHLGNRISNNKLH